MENTATRFKGAELRERKIRNAIQKAMNTRFTIQVDGELLRLGATTIICCIGSAACFCAAFLLLYRATIQEFIMLAVPMTIVAVTAIKTSVLFTRAIKLGAKIRRTGD